MNLSGNFKVVVEISKGSRLKYEVNKENGRLTLDRVLHGSNVYPYNYGYIEKTLDMDGDPLDVLIISQESLHPGVEVETRIIAAMKMIDGGDRDTKLLGVISSDPRYDEYQDLKDIPKGVLNEINDFFSNYKNLEKKIVEISGFVDKKEALGIIDQGLNLYLEKK